MLDSNQTKRPVDGDGDEAAAPGDLARFQILREAL